MPTIGGATAAAWVTSAEAGGLELEIAAVPANESRVDYAGTGADGVFDATDRDSFFGGGWGIGVNNTLIANGDPGVTSIPSEIGFYGNAGLGDELGGNRADALILEFDQDVELVSFQTSFFYSAEQSGEILEYELYDDGALVGGETVAADGTGAFSDGPGVFDYTVESSPAFDEIRFVGSASAVSDASDYLLEEIEVELADQFEPPERDISNAVFYYAAEGLDPETCPDLEETGTYWTVKIDDWPDGAPDDFDEVFDDLVDFIAAASECIDADDSVVDIAIKFGPETDFLFGAIGPGDEEVNRDIDETFDYVEDFGGQVEDMMM